MTIHGVLLDNHYGHLSGLIERVWEQSNILEDMTRTGIRIVTLNQVLPIDVDDRSLWKFSQDHRFLLFTDNRAAKGPDSLQRTIEELLQPESLPVITPGSRERLATDGEYLNRVILSLADLIIDLVWYEKFLGVGRIYLPQPNYLQ